MALDIQPLSAQRRVGMLLVLLALFLGSLGLAQKLVQARTKAPAPRAVNIIRAPQGFVDPVSEYEKLDGATLTGSGLLGGNVRRFVVLTYAFPMDEMADDKTVVAEAIRVFQRVMRNDSEVPVSPSVSRLANYGAVALEGEFPVAGASAGRAFLMERLTILSGEVLAICFSGQAPITDADRAFFDDFCETGVLVRPIQGTP